MEPKEALKIQALIKEMTLHEKASLMSGDNFWNTKPIKRLDVPSIMLTDGPHGLRKQGGKADHLGLNKSIPATCFPTAATLANSWDVDLLEEVGSCLGKEAAAENVSVILGPGLNIKRNPLAGRNFEYFSEDPYLSGKLAAKMTKGIQSQGVAACPKHFAVNSQETRRMIVDEIVDERALHELYLEGFRYVVEDAEPFSIMTSYNQVNGVYANENQHLLCDILSKEWGYQGAIVTDWGGNNDRVAGLLAGSTLEMPSTNGMTDQDIIEAVEEGRVDEKVLDLQAEKLLTLIAQTYHPDYKKLSETEFLQLHSSNHEKAVEAACRSLVLLRNEDDVLPLKSKEQKVAVVGDFAKRPRYQGAGSSLIEPAQLVSLNGALESTDLQVIGYEKGFRRYGQNSARLLGKAVKLAKQADTVLLFLGLDEGSEAEGVDRKDMKLPLNQLKLAEALIAEKCSIVVILAGGSPVELPFTDKVSAILHGYLPGEGGGEAIAKVLTGRVNPSGKLAESYPVSYEDVASSGYFPGEKLTSEHRESIFIGYRQYEYENRPVRFPFGYGLSYTSFGYQDLRVEEIVGSKGKHYSVRLTVTNTGSVSGEEIVQIYVVPQERKVFCEKKSLKGFAKVALNPNESKEVAIELDDHAFAYYHTGKERWVTESGSYEVMAAASSADIRLKKILSIEGEKAENPYPVDADSPYLKGNLNQLSSKDFEALIERKLPVSAWDTRKVLDRQDILEQVRYGGLFGKMTYGFFMFVHKLLWKMGKPILANNVLFVLGMTFRSIARMSGGMINMKMVDGLIRMLDGHFFRGLWQFVTKRKN